MCFLRNIHKNPQEKLKLLVIVGLATKKVGAEHGLVPRLAGGGSAPGLHKLDKIIIYNMPSYRLKISPLVERSGFSSSSLSVSSTQASPVDEYCYND